MYIIITKNKNLVDYAQNMNCEVFRDKDLIFVEKQNGKVDLEQFFTSFFGMLAIDPDILGYDYLKYILSRCVEEAGYYKKHMTKVIYPECAKHFNSTASCVERAMRHAIQTSFEEVPEVYTRIFNRKLKEVPSTSKFIAMMAVHIKNILHSI